MFCTPTVLSLQAMTNKDALESALAEAQKNASLLEEYHDLYELQRKRLEKQVCDDYGRTYHN